MLQLNTSEHMYIIFSHFEADQLTRNRFLKMTIFKNDSLWVTILSYQYTTTNTQLFRLFAVDRDRFRMCGVSISDFSPKSVMTHNDSSISPKKNLVFFACTVFFTLSNKPSLESIPFTELEKVRVKGLSQIYTLT